MVDKINQLRLGQCVSFARAAGYERLRLWIHSTPEAARSIYAPAGFEIVESERHRSSGQELDSEIWELRF